jgi:hypothetical protein
MERILAGELLFQKHSIGVVWSQIRYQNKREDFKSCFFESLFFMFVILVFAFQSQMSLRVWLDPFDLGVMKKSLLRVNILEFSFILRRSEVPNSIPAR